MAAERNDHRPLFPLSSLQRAYVIGQNPGFPLHTRAHYYMEYEVGPLDVDRFEAALNRMIARHDALRAVLDRSSGEARITSADHTRYRIERHDLSSLSAAQRDVAMSELRERMRSRERSAEVWPLFDIRCARLAAETWRIHVDFDLLFMDGVSMSVFYDELSLLYRNLHAALPENQFSLVEYAQSRAKVTTSKRFQRAQDYWNARLPGLALGPELPVIGNTSRPQRSRLVRQTARLAPQTVSEIRQRCEEHDVNLPSTLFTAYADILAAFSKKPRFTVSMMVQKREVSAPGVHSALGNFASTVVVEFDYTEPRPFSDRVRTTQTDMFQSLMHSDVSGVDLAQRLRRHHNDGSGLPLPVAFVITQRDALGAAGGEESSLLSMEGENIVWTSLDTPQILIDHQAMETPDGSFKLYWDGLQELFPDGVLTDMFRAYHAHLLTLARDGGAWSADVPSLVPDDQRQRRRAANDTAWPCPAELLHMPVWHQITTRPDAVAVITTSERITYGELGRVVTALTDELSARGVSPGDNVAICMRKGWEQVAAALAILSADAVFVPIAPTLPERRRWSLSERCDIRTVLVQSAQADPLSWPDGVRSLEVARGIPSVAPRPPEPVRDPTELAYIIFTSGSTGEPKGVMIDHRGAHNTVRDINERFAVSAQDRVLGISSLSFDLSIYDIFGMLAAGGALVLPEPGAVNPGAWLGLMEEHGVTVWNSVPALMQTLVDYNQVRGSRLPDSLRLVLMSGDWIPVGLPRHITAMSQDVQIISLGGATEGSIWSIIHPIDPERAYQTSIPYGRAMRNQEMHVLDARLEHRPDWVPGNIHIGGIGVAQGYFKDAERTARSFIVHPRTGARLYRTGDLGRYLPDGDIEFLGREDFQVKINGFRVELGEIEANLEHHPGVRQAAVVAPTGTRGSRRLVGYVTVDPVRPPDAAALREFLHARVPPYMVPSHLVVLDAMPLTGNGKVDRSALSSLDDVVERERDARTDPNTETEQALLGLWRTLLQLDDIGVRDDFFHIGGDSFIGILMLTRVEEMLRVALPPTILMQKTTIESLARTIDQARRAQASSDTDSAGVLVAIRSADSAPPLYLIHAASGTVMSYRELARNLPEGIPIHALQSASLRPGVAPDTSIAAMAERYRVAIMNARPDGPFFLGGWSLGGVVAYEMARTLATSGRLVEPVLLIDTPVPAEQRLTEREIRTWFVRDVLASTGATAPEVAANELAENDDIYRVLQRHGVLPADGAQKHIQTMFTTFRENLRALYEYRAPRSDIHVVQFRASGIGLDELARHPHAQRDDWGWRDIVGDRVETITVPGDHYGLTQPDHARVLAHRFARFLKIEYS